MLLGDVVDVGLAEMEAVLIEWQVDGVMQVDASVVSEAEGQPYNVLLALSVLLPRAVLLVKVKALVREGQGDGLCARVKVG